MIPYGKQNINEADINSVIEVLKSDFLTQGPVVEDFEKAIAGYCNAKYAVSVSNATAALHLSCLALGLSKGKLAWTSPNTFVATPNSVLYTGAEVDFVDIDPNSYNISFDELRKKLVEAKAKRKVPDVLLPVHFSGQSCEMEEIYQLSKEYGFHIIEDASHAVGAKYNDKPVGSCEYSDLCVFSFHPVKIITTGEGGVITTNRKDLYDLLIRLRSHGITRNPDLMTKESDGEWYYQQLELGYNYRLTELQAALGLSQLKRLDEFVLRRNQIAERYNILLKDFSIKLPTVLTKNYSSYHLFVIQIDESKCKKSHKEVFSDLRKNGIGVQLHYIPVHTQPYYQSLGFKIGSFPASEKYYAAAISLPVYFDLKDSEQDKVVETLKVCLGS
ncbi:Pyridoxal-phosphate-dependent aminotransferase [Leptospira biflexa serovar Patoc strain 'Patoc 1 (Ames)']|uniref:Putative pyridoxal-phosphate-dependent aminotransferase n=1 Tax=Leptospira biflexa serovar Patoc (strain Patoc 1 / ATCC 23582 / Paris) TaxID=456481 RepID=B0SSP8_LEPBP|nr:UDP-4-amino-4,6-dideoxy-N-acetyl-beta-L-altrosamine transaminase [Leptospira biflexa]ABZ94483.1 Pyridoxal-phosphate-dependent aminotransferase [Leptospira biflexa serovar Patoc strain 'Patoc 1 (Ames)']ABZ98138.1 Putative pyridoxal-phosphate-dependent aminotransferase [Leptospira biflexa serovar Patoc strain 'Patoc 1 (Paris)']